jgi:hypothetical protein
MAEQSASQDLGTLTGIASDLFGGTDKVKGNSTITSDQTSESVLSGENRERLEISDLAIDKIVSDILSGPDGLAAIFGGEQGAGVFNSSVANLAASDLVANIAGEIAKLRAEKVSTTDQKQVTEQSGTQATKSTQENEDKGIIKDIGDFFGF